MSGGFATLVDDVRPQLGWVEAGLAAEFPDLWIANVVVSGRYHRRSPAEIRDRVRYLSGRIDGGSAMELRRQEVPAAFRIFWRHIGLDPDEDRPPQEAAVVARLRRGGFASRGLPADAALIALIETGIPVWAWDADRISGSVGIRTSVAGERIDAEGEGLVPGTIVLADEERALATLTGDVLADVRPAKRTVRIVLTALAVAGVATLYVDEALWLASDLVRE